MPVFTKIDLILLYNIWVSPPSPRKQRAVNLLVCSRDSYCSRCQLDPLRCPAAPLSRYSLSTFYFFPEMVDVLCRHVDLLTKQLEIAALIGPALTIGISQEVSSDSLMIWTHVLTSKQTPFASGTGRFGQQKKRDYSRLVKDRDSEILRDISLLYGVVGQLSVIPGMLF